MQTIWDSIRRKVYFGLKVRDRMKTDKDYLRQLGNMLGDGVRDQFYASFPCLTGKVKSQKS